MSVIIQFRAASQHLRSSAVSLNDKLRWKLYGLAKQATDGDNKTVLPAMYVKRITIYL